MMIGPLLLALPMPNPLLLLLQFLFPPPITMYFIILIDTLFVLREEPRDSCPISQYVFKSTSCMPLYHSVVISSARLGWRDIITGEVGSRMVNFAHGEVVVYSFNYVSGHEHAVFVLKFRIVIEHGRFGTRTGFTFSVF